MWRLLHLLSVLTLPVVLTLMMGCIKAKEEKADLGPEVDFNEIRKAVAKATEAVDDSTMAVGQFVNYSYLRRLEAEENTINLGWTKVDVIRKRDEPDRYVYVFRVERASRQPDNTFEIKVGQSDYPVPKASPLPAIASLWDQDLNSYARAASGDPMAKEVTKATYHNLKVSSGSYPVPPAVKNRPGCGGLSSCDIPSTLIQFDFVEWYNDGTYQKVAVDLTFTDKTPYLPFGRNFDLFNGILISDCRATVVPIEGRTVYVRDCLNIEDFQK
jgi:hypothetical protein